MEKKLKDAIKYCMDVSEVIYFGSDSGSPLADLGMHRVLLHVNLRIVAYWCTLVRACVCVCM